MTNYAELRRSNRQSVVKEKRRAENRYRRHYNKAIEHYRRVSDSLVYFMGNQSDILLDSVVLDTLRSVVQNPETRKYLGSIWRAYETVTGQEANNAVKSMEKDLKRMLTGKETGMKIRFYGLRNRLKGAVHSIGASASLGYISNEQAEHLMGRVNPLLEPSMDYACLPKLISALQSSEIVGNFFEALNTYINALESHTPAIPENRKRDVARKNVELLEKEALASDRKRAEYFDSEEGRALAYATYMLASREKKNGGDDYKYFLEGRAEDAISCVKESDAR